MRSGLEALFKKSGNWEEVITASDGQQGIDKALSELPDAICMDVEMPNKDGITALTELTALKKQGKFEKKMPIIILSATLYENKEKVTEAKMKGAAGVMAKPDGKSTTVKVNFKKLEDTILKQL